MAVTRNGSAIRLVYDSVKKAIFKQRLKPKSALTEQSLCDALGVGHSSVRSALQRRTACPCQAKKEETPCWETNCFRQILSG